MKCPNCHNKFKWLGNSQEKLGVPILTCPKCSTSFEVRSMQKFFPKGLIILILAGIPIEFFPVEISLALTILLAIPFFKWLLKPENIVINNASKKKT